MYVLLSARTTSFISILLLYKISWGFLNKQFLATSAKAGCCLQIARAMPQPETQITISSASVFSSTSLCSIMQEYIALLPMIAIPHLYSFGFWHFLNYITPIWTVKVKMVSLTHYLHISFLVFLYTDTSHQILSSKWRCFHRTLQVLIFQKGTCSVF